VEVKKAEPWNSEGTCGEGGGGALGQRRWGGESKGVLKRWSGRGERRGGRRVNK